MNRNTSRDQFTRAEADDYLNQFRRSGVSWRAVRVKQIEKMIDLLLTLKQETGRPFTELDAEMDLHTAIETGRVLSHRKAAERWGWEAHIARRFYTEHGLLGKGKIDAQFSTVDAQGHTVDAQKNTEDDDSESKTGAIDTGRAQICTTDAQFSTGLAHPLYITYSYLDSEKEIRELTPPAPSEKDQEPSKEEQSISEPRLQHLMSEMKFTSNWPDELLPAYEALSIALGRRPDVKWLFVVTRLMLSEGHPQAAEDDDGDRHSGYSLEQVLRGIERLGNRSNYSPDMLMQLVSGKAQGRKPSGGKGKASTPRQSPEDTAADTLESLLSEDTP